MEHPAVRQIERTGYPLHLRNPQIFAIDPITCECGCRAVLKINGNHRCAQCGEDEGVEVL